MDPARIDRSKGLRLAVVAAALSIVVLGGLIAEAETLDATFNVAAAPMQVSIVGSSTVALPPIPAGQPVPWSAELERTSQLAYTNPSSQPGAARVLIARTTNPDLGGLEIQLGVVEHPSEVGGSGTVLRFSAPAWRFASDQELTLADRIPLGSDHEITLTWVVTSHKDDWDVPLGQVESVFTFTIEQE